MHFSFSCLLLVYACQTIWASSITHTTQRSVAVDEHAKFPDLYEASIAEIQDGLEKKHYTSVDLVKAYFARIDEVNLQGAELRAVLEKSPTALAQAAALDRERKTKGKRGPLHGIPVLLKDNIATVASDGMNTTAGSFALLGSIVPGDATVVAKLRKAGAIIIGKLNMSEWAQFRFLPSGWTGRGGQSTNPYFPNGDPCGSSSGSAIATAIGLATFTLGTETDGSITCPSSNQNVAGIKPSIGITSRNGVIPLSSHQDTVGPIARSLTDAVTVLNIIAGPDPADNDTLSQPLPVPDYSKALSKTALKGKRIGVPRNPFLNDTVSGNDPAVNVAFNKSLDLMRSMGAIIVDPADLPSGLEITTDITIIAGGFPVNTHELVVLTTDFKVQLNNYIAALKKVPTGVRNLADIITFNDAHKAEEEPKGFEDQSNFVLSESTTGFNATYFDALAKKLDQGRTRGIDAALKNSNLDALVLPATGYTRNIAALAAYPIVTVPMDFYPANTTIRSVGPTTVYPAPGIPFGISFFGTAFSDFELIGLGYAYEQATHARLGRRAYDAAIPKTQLADIVGKY